MASQLRLQVVLPVAVLGLLGLGVGAFALGGQGPADDGSTPPLTTTHESTTTTPVPTETAVGKAAWAKAANNWCVTLGTRLNAIGPITSVDKASEFVNLVDAAGPEFVNLGWPRGEKSAVLALRKNLAKTATKAHEVLSVAQTGDLAAGEQAARAVDELGPEWNRIMTRLGATKCVGDLSKSSAKGIKSSASATSLRQALVGHRVVVVLFYAPGDDYDTIQTRETRAGALAVEAGFLALNVKKNAQIAALAAQYEVRDAPATLIFVRGPRVVYRVAGYMDRSAIAQAAANAGI